MQSYDMFQSSVIVRYKNIPNEKPFYTVIRTVGREGYPTARITDCYLTISAGRYLNAGTQGSPRNDQCRERACGGLDCLYSSKK